MKIQRRAAKGFSLSVTKAGGNSAPVPLRVIEMVHDIFREAGVHEGKFSYQVSGRYKMAADDHVAQAGIMSMKGRQFRLIVKYARERDRAVSGILRPPKDVAFGDLAAKLTQAVAALNESVWKGKYKDEAEVPEAPKSKITPPAPDTVSDRSTRTAATLSRYTPHVVAGESGADGHTAWYPLILKLKDLRQKFLAKRAVIDAAVHDIDQNIADLSARVSKKEKLELLQKSD